MIRFRSFDLIIICIVMIPMATSSCRNAKQRSSNEYISFFENYGGYLKNEYRIPFGDDLSYWGTDINTYFYKSTDNEGNYKAPYWTRGDFNDDGIIDRCYLLFHNGRNDVNLFVFLSTKDTMYRIIKLSSANKFMGVRTVKVTRKGCSVDAIDLFEFEGHGKTFVWHQDMNLFREEGSKDVITNKSAEHRTSTNNQVIKLAVDLKKEKELQQEVDKGHQPWRLEPLDVAYATIPTTDKKVAYENCTLESETSNEAVVKCEGEKMYVVSLKRLVREHGIWTAVQIEVTNGT